MAASFPQTHVLPLAYLGSIHYYAKLCLGPCVIDAYEHYVKQSLRNRCTILGPNGTIDLVVPVVNPGNFNKTAVRETLIDNSDRWAHRHWQAIVSAYGKSPYFDYYRESFEPFYTGHFDSLFELNDGLMRNVLRLLGSESPPNYSPGYMETSAGIEDWRHGFSGKPRLAKEDSRFVPEPYWQVFSPEGVFIPNLSILDLLMCEGPAAMDILRASYRI